MRQAITLTKDRKKLKGGIVEYWTLRWHGQDGKFHSKGLGRTDKVSKRQALKKKRLMEQGFDAVPGSRNIGKGMSLKAYTDLYFEARSHELAKATIVAYRDGIRYLIGHFDEHRRIDQISRADAAMFKSALAAGKLKHVMTRKSDITPATVNRYMRGIKAVFGKAVADELLPYNPFDRTVTTIKQSTDWHYVSGDEFNKITEAAAPKFKVVISLCRLAGLRREEALRLEWCNIDWSKSRIIVVGKSDWQPKSKKTRTVPMCPELAAVLMDAYEAAPEGQSRVLAEVYDENLGRDVKATVKRAGVAEYGKPLHTLRKSCITDWAGQYPMHVVKEWAGHSNISTTQQFYLKVLDCDYERAATSSFWKKVTENVTENGKNDSIGHPADTNKEAQTGVQQ